MSPAITKSRQLSDYVFSDPDRLGGETVFKGTRVPVRTLFVYLRKGNSLEKFLEDFEDVDREQALAILDLAESGVLSSMQRA